jgi:hypothetical protein
MLPFFQWLESFGFGAGSEYTVAFINVAHLLALVVFIGAVLVVDLRLLGSGMRQQPLGQVARDAQPWLIGGFAAMALTGALQVLATPMKAYFSDQFWLKMQLLVVAVLLTFGVRWWVTRRDEARGVPVAGKLVGVASIALWCYIAVQGRLIGLLQ